MEEQAHNTEKPASAKRGFWRVVVFGRRPAYTLVRLFVWAVLLVFISKFIVLPVRILGVSMLPTYKDNRVNFINRLAYVSGQPKRYDVVAIQMAGEHVMLLKRVIGLPGETVGFHNGKAVIDGAALPEPYLVLPSDWERAPVKLGPGEFFVVGDNRSMPQLDHDFGIAKRVQIVGKAML